MDAESLDEAVRIADAAGSVREAAAALRSRFASLRVVAVDAFDMRHEVPAACGSARSLWFAASDGHCWEVTSDASRAAGLYIADRGGA